MRFRHTEICNTCSKLKNVCQSCILDLQYSLPVQVRDSVLGVSDTVPKNEPNREYFIAANAARLARGDGSLLDYDKALEPAAKAILHQIARKTPNYERNLAPPCSFYAKGICTRGDACPYRHVLLAQRPPSLQSYRNRYYGENDPDAEKILERSPDAVQKPTSNPEDRSLMSLYIQGMRSGDLSPDEISAFFNVYGDVSNVSFLADGTAAIVSFSNREGAEDAAEQTLGVIDIKGVSLQVSWSKSKSNSKPRALPASSLALDQPLETSASSSSALPSPSADLSYPAQDPTLLKARLKKARIGK